MYKKRYKTDLASGRVEAGGFDVEYAGLHAFKV
jgi:hypothetical protein